MSVTILNDASSPQATEEPETPVPAVPVLMVLTSEDAPTCSPDGICL
jgi:hypothetical protein